MNPSSIEAIRELVEEPLEVLGSFEMVSSDHESLEIGRDCGDPGENPIHLGRRHAGMRIVAEAQVRQREEGQAPIGSQTGPRGESSLCPGLGGESTGWLGDFQAGKSGATLPCADSHPHGLGALGFIPPLSLKGSVAELRVIELDESDELVPSISVGHGGSDLMRHGPGRLIRAQSKPSLGLEHGDPVLILPQEKDEPEPGLQGYPGFMEDRTRCQRDLMPATPALIHATGSDPVALRSAAPRAFESVGPAALLQVLAACQFSGESALDPEQIVGLIHGHLL